MEALYPHHLARANTSSPPIAVLDAAAVSRSPRALQAALDALGAASAEAQRLPAPITSAARMACDASQRVYVALPWGYSGGGAPCAPLGFLKVGQRALYLAVPPRAAGSAGVPDPSALVSSLAAAAAAAAAGSSSDRRGGGGARGSRRLGGAGSMWECSPLCVLDFYVEAAARRRGVGRALLDCMMRSEGVAHPAVLAYVRGRRPRAQGASARALPPPH